MAKPSEHKFAREQRVEYEGPQEFPPTMEVVALLPSRCVKHDAPHYGCVHQDTHFTICEAYLKSMSPTNRKKLN